MGKLVVTEFVTLDGVFEDPGGAGDFDRGGWAFQFDQGEEGAKFKFDELVASDAQLLGRVTYEGFAKAWPTMEGTGEFGEKMNAMPKFVVSTTLENPEWNNTTVLNGDLATEVGELKQRFGGDILVAGSGKLVSSLLANDLVDELHLMVFPIVLGDGRRLFANVEATRSLQHVETKQTGEGAIMPPRRDRSRSRRRGRRPAAEKLRR
jgi:dihydrofolate reductase